MGLYSLRRHRRIGIGVSIKNLRRSPDRVCIHEAIRRHSRKPYEVLQYWQLLQWSCNCKLIVAFLWNLANHLFFFVMNRDTMVVTIKQIRLKSTSHKITFGYKPCHFGCVIHQNIRSRHADRYCRWIRWMKTFGALFVPPLIVAAPNYAQSRIMLILNLAASRLGVLRDVKTSYHLKNRRHGFIKGCTEFPYYNNQLC